MGLLNLNVLLEWESNRRVVETVGGRLSESCYLEIVNLENLDVVRVVLGDARKTGKLTRRRRHIEHRDIAVRSYLCRNEDSSSRGGHGCAFVVDIRAGVGHIHLEIAAEEYNLNMDIAGYKVLHVDAPLKLEDPGTRADHLPGSCALGERTLPWCEHSDIHPGRTIAGGEVERGLGILFLLEFRGAENNLLNGAFERTTARGS